MKVLSISREDLHIKSSTYLFTNISVSEPNPHKINSNSRTFFLHSVLVGVLVSTVSNDSSETWAGIPSQDMGFSLLSIPQHGKRLGSLVVAYTWLLSDGR